MSVFWNEQAKKYTANEIRTLVNSGAANAIVENLVPNGDFKTVTGWEALYGIVGAEDGVLSIAGDGANKTPVLKTTKVIAIKTGEKYYYRAKIRVTNDQCMTLKVSPIGGYGAYEINNPTIDHWYEISGISTAGADSSSILAITIAQFYTDSTTANGKIMQVQDVVLFKITDIGLGENPQLYKYDAMVKANNDYWEGKQTIIAQNINSTMDLQNKENAGFVILSPSAFHSRTRSALVTFVCDDGHKADYTKLHGFSEKYGIPFVSAIYKNSTMPISDMLYLQNQLGWEFASHSYNHVDLSTLTTEAEIEEEMLTSKEWMTSIGLECDNLVLPYGGSDERVRRIAKKYFKCCATTNSGINNGVVPQYALQRCALGAFYYDDGSYNEYKAWVDQAVNENGWLIFMLHPNNAAHTEDQNAIIEQVIQYIQSLSIPVKTLRDGLDDFGNALEVGDYIGSINGIAISKTGQMANISTA